MALDTTTTPKAATLSEASVLRFEIEQLIRHRDALGLPEVPVANDYMLKFALKDAREVLSMIKVMADRPALRSEAATVIARNIGARSLRLMELGEEVDSSGIEAFMFGIIKVCDCEDTPMSMLRAPAEDIGLADASERWVAQIIESDDPDTEFEMLINHLSGLLANVELVRKHYREFSKQAERAAA